MCKRVIVNLNDVNLVEHTTNTPAEKAFRVLK